METEPQSEPAETQKKKKQTVSDRLSTDDSIEPSYTDLKLPYCVVCRQRYHRAGLKQRRQFIKEIHRQELLQIKALDGVRIHREFINPIMEWPKPEEIIKLTPKEQFRLEELMRE